MLKLVWQAQIGSKGVVENPSRKMSSLGAAPGGPALSCVSLGKKPLHKTMCMLKD